MKDTLKVLSGTAHPELAHLICNNLGINLCATEVTTFPDGETFVQIHENIRGRDIFIVQPTCPPTNQNLMEMLIMVDALRRSSAARIAASLVSCVTSTTGTASPGLRPRCSMDSKDMPSSRNTAVTSAITPGRSTTIKRK